MKKDGQKSGSITRRGLLGFLLAGGAAIAIKNLPSEKTPGTPKVIAPEDLCKAFDQSDEVKIRLAKIEYVIQKVKAGDIEDYPLIQIAVRDYEQNQRRYREQTLKLEQDNNIVGRLRWDLRVLGFHTEDDPEIASTFTMDVAEAIVSFQRANGLTTKSSVDRTTGLTNLVIDDQTLRVLSQKAFLQNLLIGLYIKETSLLYNVPEIDLHVVIDVESSGNPLAKAKTTSAEGLGQFLKGTAREVVAKFGDILNKCHLQAPARRINAALRKTGSLPADLESYDREILDLRKDMRMATRMVAVHGKSVNGGRFVADEVYAKHFSGEGGANILLKNPDKFAHIFLPEQAKKNLRIYYKKVAIKKDKKGKAVIDPVTKKPVLVGLEPRTCKEVYDYVVAKVRDKRRIAKADVTVKLTDHMVSDHSTPTPVLVRTNAGTMAQIQLK